jgi:RHS repeat-associated protein
VHAFSRALLYSFAYDASGRLSSVADGYGNTLTTQRDMAGKLTGFVAPGGQTTALTENANGYIASVTNPLGHVHQMTYSASGLMLTYTDPRSGVHTFTYDGQGRLQSDANPVGTTTLTHTKLADGWRVDHTSPAGRVTKYQTQKTVTGTELLTVTDPANLVSTFHLSAADAGPGSTKGTLPSGALITQTKVPDPIWKMAIPFTAREDIRLPSGLTKSTSFGRNISLANQADPLSVTQTLMVTRENLDPQRDFATLYSRDGGSAFDGGVMLTVSPLARTRVIAFNAQGRVVSDQVTGLAAEQSTYDGLGRLVARVWGGRATLYAYDMQGNLTQVSDPLARSITYAHDALGRVTVITYSDGRHFDLTLDANGNVSSATPPGSTAHTFAFDTLDSLGRYSPPAVSGTGVGHTDYAYNADEQLVTETRPDTSLIAASYDVAGRPSTVTFSSGGTFANTYAADSGFLTSISGPAGVGLAFTYDGPLLTGTSWTGDGGVNGSISRTYDTSFRPLSESVNGAHIVPFGYDRDGLLVDAGALTLGRNAQNGLIVSSAIGVSPAIATDSITYNAFAECTAYTASHNGVALYAASYSRDALGRVTQRVEAIGGVTTTYDYVYDAADRLAAVHLNGAVMPAYAYAYDANGNRVSALSPLGTVAASYDAQDRLIQQGAVSYAYSASGALASTTQGAAVTDYAYDGAGDLKSVTLPTGTVVTYIDDGLHRRVGRRVDGVLTQGFLRSGRLRIAAELDPSGAVASRFVYATRLNVPEYMVKGGNTYRIFSDDLGSPRLIVNVADGTVAQRLDYDPFGAVTNDTNPGFQPFGFAGGLYDPQTKLVRFGARDYDAQAGRWTSKDPKRFGGGDTNLYAYVRNDPVNLYDPRGREIILWQNGIHRGVSIGTDGHYVSYDLNPGSETIAATKGRVDPKNHGPPDDAEIIKRGTGDDAAAIAKAEELKQAIDSGDAFYWVANGWVGGSQGLNCVGFANAVARAGGVEPPAYFPFWDVAKKQWSSLLWP